MNTINLKHQILTNFNKMNNVIIPN